MSNKYSDNASSGEDERLLVPSADKNFTGPRPRRDPRRQRRAARNDPSFLFNLNNTTARRARTARGACLPVTQSRKRPCDRRQHLAAK